MITDIKPTVQLSGLDGNVLAVIGRCVEAARLAGWPKERVDLLRYEMLDAENYDHVLRIAMKYITAK